MCGIAGWVRPAGAPIDPGALAAMTATLAHRGPDGEGLHVEPGCGLGHRRLTLLDAPGGGQPMANEDATVWVVANNEIYNYRELRDALVGRGHQFVSRSDTEVLVHAYEEHGAACVEALVGMYAFALWDRRTRTLLLARDRFGIKPLYYIVGADGSLRFASELRALLAIDDLDRTLDLAAIREYFRHLTVPEPHTPLGAIRKLPAAHWLTWHEWRVALHRYWALPDRCSEAQHADDVGQLERAVVDSVALTLRSDEPLGLFLSGGIDSGVLAWAMRRNDAELRTFSVGFAEPQFDESPHSRAIAAALGSTHREIRVGCDEAVAAAIEILARIDEPFADSSALPTYLLAGAARPTVKAVLAGEGADELFGGSLWHDVDRAASDDADVVAPTEKVVFTAPELDALFSAEAQTEIAGRPYDPAELRSDVPRGLDALHRQLRADLMIYLPSDLLAKMDRMSMLQSLEVRVPYLNHPLAEYIWRLPTAAKQRDGIRKYLLRAIAARHLPPSIAIRRKQGFGIPIDIWTWRPGRFRDLVYDTLRGRRFRERGWLQSAAVDRMLAEHDRLHAVHGHRLWTLVVLEHWLARAW